MGLEQEIKLRLPDAAALEQIAHSERIATCRCSPPARIEMRTTYFDTPQGLLGQKKWALRRRMEGERAMLTMKTAPDGLLARGEWNLPAGGLCTETQILPAALAALVEAGAPAALGRLDAAALRPVCGVRFVRRRCDLRLDADTTAELALDAGELLGQTVSAPFFELELELLHGSFEVVRAFAAQLQREFDLQIEPRSKLERARALRAQERTDHA